MPLYPDDVSEYVARETPEVVRLIVEIQSAPRPGQRRDVTAQVDDDGTTFTGEFAISPEWVQPTDSSRVPTGMSSVQPDGRGSSVGAQLFSALFSGGLSRCWAQAVDRARLKGGLHVVIRSADLAVQSLPWELLADPLAAAGSITLVDNWSVVRDCAAPELRNLPVQPGSVLTGDMRILVVTSDTGGASQGLDAAIIQDAFVGAEIETFPGIGREELQRILRGHPRELVHLLATGGRSRQGRLVLLLSPLTSPDSILAPEIVDELRQVKEMPRLVVLAASDSDLFAAELARGVPNVIGIRGVISDLGCQAFLRGLYKALSSGSTVDRAVAAGRAQQIGFSRALAEEWSLPVLFLTDPTPLVVPPQVDLQATPGPPSAPSLGSPVEQVDQLLLAMNESNLASLRGQWQQVEGGHVPSFIQDQIARLDNEVKRLSHKIKGAPS